MRRSILALPSLLSLLAACAVNYPPVEPVKPPITPEQKCAALVLAADAACAKPTSRECTVAATLAVAAGCSYEKPKPPEDPCYGKAPICRAQSDVDCWAMNKDGVCQYWPTATPPPPPPVDPPAACMNEAALKDVADPPAQQLQEPVARAIAELGPSTGIAPAVSLEKLAAKLRSYGLCAIAGIEAVFVRRSDGLVEEYHAVYFRDGSWTNSGNGRFIGIHSDSDGGGAVPPPPPPAPPPSGGDYGCQAPVPPRVWTRETLPDGWGEDEIGRPRFAIQAKRHTGDTADSTPVVQRACEYCAAIGLGEMGGAPRCGCPVRPDGHPGRVACEDVLLLPPAGAHGPKWVRPGSNVAIAACDVTDTDPCVTANPFLALIRGARLQACSWDAVFKDGKLVSGVCSEVVQ